jgi:hypothetical protein
MDEITTARLLKNYLNARKSWEGWCYLNSIHLKQENPAIRKYADDNELIYHCRYLLLKDLNIELYKIVSRSKYTEDKVFKLLEVHGTEQALELINDWNEIESKLMSLTDTRDKFYAHLDKDYETYLSSFPIDDYYEIFELIEASIIALGKEKELYEILKSIPSRDDFELKIGL